MNIDNFIQRANAYFGMNITSPIKTREYVDSRRMAINYIRANSTYPLSVIGEKFERDHSSIISNLRRHDDLINYDPQYKREYHNFCQAMHRDDGQLVVSVSDEVMIELQKLANERACSINDAATLVLNRIKYPRIRTKEYRKYTKKDYDIVKRYKAKGVTRRKIAHKLGWTIQQVQYVTHRINHG